MRPPPPHTHTQVVAVRTIGAREMQLNAREALVRERSDMDATQVRSFS